MGHTHIFSSLSRKILCIPCKVKKVIIICFLSFRYFFYSQILRYIYYYFFLVSPLHFLPYTKVLFYLAFIDFFYVQIIFWCNLIFWRKNTFFFGSTIMVCILFLLLFLFILFWLYSFLTNVYITYLYFAFFHFAFDHHISSCFIIAFCYYYCVHYYFFPIISLLCFVIITFSISLIIIIIISAFLYSPLMSVKASECLFSLVFLSSFL